MTRVTLVSKIDTADAVAKKIRKAQTDPTKGIYYCKDSRPGVSNLMTILSAVTHASIAEIQAQYGVGHSCDTSIYIYYYGSIRRYDKSDVYRLPYVDHF